jgi:hypothetical protein
MSLLDERFSDIDLRLGKKLRDARSFTSHRGVRGDELAGVLGNEILNHFVESASLHEKCEVRGHLGGLSQEIDLVLLNRFHPAFLVENRPRAPYIEGVIAAAEVKTSLNKRETLRCLEKARSFKRLKAKVDGKDLQGHTFDIIDLERYLVRRPFFAFAYEDDRTLHTVQSNIEQWTTENEVPLDEQIDAVFVLNKGIIVNLGTGHGTIEMRDPIGDPLSGFVRNGTVRVFSQLILWLSLVCPSFSPLYPILLRHASFNTDGYVT